MNQYFSHTLLKKTLTQSLFILALVACGGGGGSEGSTSSPPVITTPPVEEATEYTGTITGVVVDSNGNPIEGAQVYVIGSETLTNAGGQYIFSDIVIPVGTESLIVTVSALDNIGDIVKITPANQVNNVGGDSTIDPTDFAEGFTAQAPTLQLANLKAIAGEDVNVLSNQLVGLDGSKSIIFDGQAQFLWEIISAPEDSSIELSDTSSISPSFTPVAVGTYTVKLTVTDADGDTSEDEISINVTKIESTPVANAGSYQLVKLGDTVTLDGTGSADADGDGITYLWESYENYVCDNSTSLGLIECVTLFPPCPISTNNACGSAPDGEGLLIIDAFGVIETTDGWYTHTAELDDATSARPSFVASEVGEYKFVLTVTDGRNTSQISQISITEIDVVQGNLIPIANAGEDRKAVTNNEITLNGSLSTDGDNDLLTYTWSFTSKPNGSSAFLFNELTDAPSFVPDMDGEYLVSLIVNDGEKNSEIDNAIITAGPLTVATVAISADEFEVFKGRTLQLNAVATMTDESEVGITNEGVWSVSSSTRATINAQGLLTGIKAGTTNVTFTPNDSSVPATTQSVKIKSISDLGDNFVTSLSSSVSIINGTIQNGSQFSFTIENNTGETMSLLRFEVRDSSGIKAFTESASELSGGSLTNGERVGLQYTVNSSGALTPLTLEYSLVDFVTGESFKVSYVYSGPTFP